MSDPGVRIGNGQSVEPIDPRWGANVPHLIVSKCAIGLAVALIGGVGLVFADRQWVGRGLLWGGLGGVTVGMLELNDCFAAIGRAHRGKRSFLVDTALGNWRAALFLGLTYVAGVAAVVTVLWAGTRLNGASGWICGALAGYWVSSTAVGYGLVAGRSSERVRLIEERPPTHPFPVSIPNPNEFLRD